MNRSTNSHDAFKEISSLLAMFEEAKKLRPVRQPVHVLIVEDDLLTQRMVKNALKDNYATIAACEAYEAVADYLIHAPDIVFLDIGLPDIDGFVILDQIMAADPDAYVVMFSANLNPETIQQATAAGAKGFISKPFQREQLHRYIQGSAIHHQRFGK